MPQLIKQCVIAEDRWSMVRDAANLTDLPDGEPVIVPLRLWTERRGGLIARGEVGVWLAGDEDPAALADDLARLPLIAIDFSREGDTGGHAHARLLRQRHGYAGELRAIGAVRPEALDDLARCGFDSFLVAGPASARGAGASLHPGDARCPCA